MGAGDTLSVCLAAFDGALGVAMAEDRIGLADFLSDLRAELSEAQSRVAGDSLKLGVEEISLTLEVAYTLTKAGEASAGVKAKFWVFASAQADLKGSLSSERAGTQQLTLTLKPRVEQVVIDRQGQQTTVTRGVDVEGALAAGEEDPALPSPGRS
jgi:Trypsin-co-occurring domain 2